MKTPVLSQYEPLVCLLRSSPCSQLPPGFWNVLCLYKFQLFPEAHPGAPFLLLCLLDGAFYMSARPGGLSGAPWWTFSLAGPSLLQTRFWVRHSDPSLL